MKKKFTHFFLLSSLLAGSASAADFHYLEGINTESGVENFTFEYNELNKISQELYISYEEPSASTVRKFNYDENGNCIEELVYQDYYMTEDPSQFILVIKVEYAYNEANQMTRRTGYGLDIYLDPEHPENCPLSIQSYLDFSYNEDGTLSSVATSFASGMQIQKDEYLYDEAGLLYKVDSYSTFFGDPQLQSSIRYSFYDNNVLASAATYYPGYDGDMWRQDVTDYVYDEDWNLKDVELWNGGHNTIVSRDSYTYNDSFSIDSTIYPLNFEDTFWKGNLVDYIMVKKPIATRVSYTINDYTGELDYLDTYTYNYSDTPSGIKSVLLPNGAKSAVLKSLRNGKVEIVGVESNQNVRLIDMQGQTLYNGKYGNGVNISNLGQGTYCIITDGGAIKFAK